MTDEERAAFSAAVLEAGLPAAAAFFDRSESQIKRWMNGTSTPPQGKERAVRDFVRAYPADPQERPLHRFSDDELLRELHTRLALLDRSTDTRRARRSATVSDQNTPVSTVKTGRSRLDGARGSAKGGPGNAADKGGDRT